MSRVDGRLDGVMDFVILDFLHNSHQGDYLPTTGAYSLDTLINI